MEGLEVFDVDFKKKDSFEEVNYTDINTPLNEVENGIKENNELVNKINKLLATKY